MAAILSPISYLPSEVVGYILLRLPVDDLIRCMCVLKRWNAIIRSQKFIKDHLKCSLENKIDRSIVLKDDQADSDFFSLAFYARDSFSNARRIAQPLTHPGRDTVIVGNCNGLLCIYNRFHDNDLAVWNPSIHRFRRIPFTPIEIPPSTKGSYPTYGFGFDITNDDYKLVRIVEFHNIDRKLVGSEVKLYSLRGNSWKRIQSLPCTGISYYSHAVPLNGALHWLVNHRSHSNEERVLTLDLATETFKEFPTPFAEIDCGIGLEVLGSNLCICVNHFGTQNDVWLMKKYGVADSWTPLYTIKQEAVDWLLEYCRPLVFSNTGKRVLLQSNSDITLDKNLFWYDLEKKMVKELKIPGLPSLFTAAICVGSLLLFDGDPVARQQQAKRKFEAGNSRNCLF
ncbi:hypothetical protein M0R45_011247 [Rubus argutus]|uniref:F-box domain-containing protein n=1 Tax=Rubus argutus TaxID=59490 RepID=A0AAW1YDG0_RUBAR